MGEFTKEPSLERDNFEWEILNEYPNPLVDIDYTVSTSNSSDNAVSNITVVFSASLWKIPQKKDNETTSLAPIWYDCELCLFEITVTRPGELCSTEWVSKTS